MRTKTEIMILLNDISDKCRRHSKRCTKCYMPIMDDEGNPKLIGEACKVGAELLRNYYIIENEYWIA